LSSFGVDLTNCACASVLVHIRDDDGCPLVGQSPGDHSPYPGTRTGNHSDFLFDLHYAFPPLACLVLETRKSNVPDHGGLQYGCSK
jgi:hypothetical protein